MIAALAEGARVLGNAEYEAAAERAARFVLAQMRGADGRLFHRFRLGERAVRGQATDYAFMVHGLLHLYRATFRVEWAEEAAALQRVMVAELWDEAAGGFFLAAPDERELPVRPKDLADGAAPSANSVALTNLLWLSRLTGDTGWAERAQTMVRAFAGTIERQPAGFVYFLCGLDFWAAARPGRGARRRGAVPGRPAADRCTERALRPQPGRALQVRGERRPSRAPWPATRTGSTSPGRCGSPSLRRRILQGVGHERGRPCRTPRGENA